MMVLKKDVGGLYAITANEEEIFLEDPCWNFNISR